MPEERVLRGLGLDEDGLLARPERPRRWTLPITALRVIPPSSAAIWLADRPSAHSFARRATLSSVQLIGFSPRHSKLWVESTRAIGHRRAPDPHASGMTRNHSPHEISYRPT